MVYGMKVTAIIQARMSSERLPGKILVPLAGYPLLKVIRERTKQAQVDSWWLATSSHQSDDLTEFWGHTLGLNVYRGDLNNVLSRFTAIARQEQPDWIIRLTADNPFVDHKAINILVDYAQSCAQEVSYLKAPEPRILPLGYMPEIVRAKDLLSSEHQIPKVQGYHQSHVTSWIKETMVSGIVEIPNTWENRCYWRWTVDTLEDYYMSRDAFDLFGDSWLTLDYQGMVKILDRHPEVTSVNGQIMQKLFEEG